MVFSADDRVLIIKCWGRSKETVRKIHRRISQQARFRGSCRSMCIAAGFMTLTSWSHAWSKSGNISTRYSSMKRPGSGVHVFQLAFEHTEGILNTYLSYVWYLYRRTLRQSHVCAVAYSGHFCFGGDLTKPSITIASVDRFYWNLVSCLQLDIALLVQNFVKIWHCLSELWQCIQGWLFSWTQCIYNSILSLDGKQLMSGWEKIWWKHI